MLKFLARKQLCIYEHLSIHFITFAQVTMQLIEPPAWHLLHCKLLPTLISRLTV